MPSLLCPHPIIQSQSMEKFKLDLVNDLVKEAIEALCKRKRWRDTFRHIIKAKRFNPNRAIDNRAAFGLVLVLTS